MAGQLRVDEITDELGTGSPEFPNGVAVAAAGISFSDSTTQTSAAATSANVQTFDASGTWTKPTNNGTMARIQVWGGGGGGGRTTAAASGGGGGGYNEITVPLSFLASSMTVTVGAAGVGRTGSTGNGTAGGTSSVTIATAYNGKTTFTAFGGGGGGSRGDDPGNGGGPLFAGATANFAGASSRMGAGSRSTQIHVQDADNPFCGAAGGFTEPYGATVAGGSAVYGGGGGARGSLTAGGTSALGGNGGSGAVGQTPAGGGSGGVSSGANGFNGGGVRIIITVW